MFAKVADGAASANLVAPSSAKIVMHDAMAGIWRSTRRRRWEGNRFFGEASATPQIIGILDQEFGAVGALRISLNGGIRIRNTTSFTNHDPGPDRPSCEPSPISLAYAPTMLAYAPPEAPRRLALASREPRRTVTVDGVALAVHDSAPGRDLPVVVCLHAIGHGGGDFSRFEDAVGHENRVITIDWPGHGASGQDTRPASAARYAELLQGMIEALELDRLVLLGNSIGGAAAVRYAAELPARVDGLILSNPGGFDRGGFFAGIFIRLLERHFRAGVEDKASFASWFRNYYAGILITEEALAHREAIVLSAYESAPRLLEAWRSFRTAEADQRALAVRLTMPVLVAWASEDRIIRWSRSRAAIEAVPNRRVVMFQAGHSPFLETSQAFAAEARVFLRGLR